MGISKLSSFTLQSIKINLSNSPFTSGRNVTWKITDSDGASTSELYSISVHSQEECTRFIYKDSSPIGIHQDFNMVT